MGFGAKLIGGWMAACLGVMPAVAANDLPHLVAQNGRHALIVDGKPFLMLGAQVNNAANYASALPKVWPTIDALGANTVEVPVAWEQIEPVEGKFDFSFLDTLLDQARAHGKRLVILWFGTWKNTNANYTPAWVKLDPKRFPRMTNTKGQLHYVLSPHGANTLAADRNAFVHLMQHLKEADPQNSVIMVQVENETGSYGLARDHSPQADKLFAGPVPAPLAAKVGKKGNWTQVFGRDAEAAFNSWYLVCGKLCRPGGRGGQGGEAPAHVCERLAARSASVAGSEHLFLRRSAAAGARRVEGGGAAYRCAGA